MSNARIHTFNGQPTITFNNKTFGQTISDREIDPNLIQTTSIPAIVDGIKTTIQISQYVLGIGLKTPDTGTTPAVLGSDTTLFVKPDLILTQNKFYQISATITLILRTSTEIAEYHSGCWTLTAAVKDNTLLGVEGYVLTSITSDHGIESYIPNSAITLSISPDNQLTFMVMPVFDIVYSADLLVDTKITSTYYSTTA
jgi:hypothetical protein